MAVLIAVPEPVIVKVVDEELGAEIVIVIADAEAGRSARTRNNLLIVTNLIIMVSRIS